MRLTNGKICARDKIITDKDLFIRQGRIFLEQKNNDTKNEEKIIDLKNSYVLPGFVETHTHGAGLFDLTMGRYDPRTNTFNSSPAVYQEELPRYVRMRTGTGVASLYLGTVAAPVKQLQFCLKQLKKYMDSGKNGQEGCFVKGGLLEGTFLNPQMCGAQNPGHVLLPDIKKFDEINESGAVKLINVVPDYGEPAFKLTKYLVKKGLKVGAGHTQAAAGQVKTAVDKGLSYIIHFLNGPTGNSFKPFDGGGAVEGILQDDRVYVELIVDGFHVNLAYVRDVIKRKGFEKVILVTDALFVSQAEGVTDFEVNGIPGRMSQDKAYVYVVDKKPISLFGSVLTMDKAFSNILSLLTKDIEGVWYGEHKALAFDQALLLSARMCSTNVCDMLKTHGAEDPQTGSIEEGKWADLLVADIKGQPGNYRLNVRDVFVRGNNVFSFNKKQRQIKKQEEKGR